MIVSRLAVFIVISFLIISFTSCDDYNIVEPRFFDADEVEDVSIRHFGQSIAYCLPVDSHVEIIFMGGAGNIIDVLVNENQAAGNHSIDWNWRDDDGIKYPNGVYCFLINAGNWTEMSCVYYEDDEGNLP